MRAIRVTLGLAICVFMGPVLAHAQATLAGTVRDTSGSVLPGVTVEVSSPALIEKTRSTVTDSTGQYRITELPPGEYAVRFSLSGFSTMTREGLPLSGSGVIPVNMDMRIGGIQEAIVVSGEPPVVDTQTTRREVVIDANTINTLPATRSYGGILFAVPGLSVSCCLGGNEYTPGMAAFTAHGGNSTEGRVMVPFSTSAPAVFFGFCALMNADATQ